MSSLADIYAAGPDRREPSGTLELGVDGGTFDNVRFDAPVASWDDILVRLNLDPTVFAVDGDSVRVSSWQQSKRTDTGDRDVVTLYSYRGQITSRRETIDLPALYAAATRRPKAFKPVVTDRVTVVVLSDAQIGKVASRGGTPELIARLQAKRDLLESRLRRFKPASTILIEAGDLFENFQSGGNPMGTNDLSLTQQMDLAGTEILEFVKVLNRHGHVDVMCTTSNHTQWRQGRTQLGHAGDDLGIYVHRQAEKVAHAASWDVSWHYPAYHDESLAFTASTGTTIGLVHGNQFAPGQAEKWWASQQHGGQPTAAADILVYGHYHALRILPSGRNAHGRPKWILQAPTLDNGSDWYRNTAGDDSDPGLLVFDVTDNGFSLQSLTVL